MREYKFRAWDETEKHMYNWGNLLNQTEKFKEEFLKKIEDKDGTN